MKGYCCLNILLLMLVYTQEAALEFQRNLMKFDEDFERGIELPSIFMKLV